jgi:hypothetical protein
MDSFPGDLQGVAGTTLQLLGGDMALAGQRLERTGLDKLQNRLNQSLKLVCTFITKGGTVAVI